MPSTPTTKYGLITEADGDPLVSAPGRLRTMAAAIDSNMAGYAEGTLAAIPAAGKAGRIYRATDTGQVFLDTGTVWVEMERRPQRGYAEVLTGQSTTSTTPGDLATVGPSVTLDVPANGRVGLFAAVVIGGAAVDGIVTLAENGTTIGMGPIMNGGGPTGVTYYTSQKRDSGIGPLVGSTERHAASELIIVPTLAGTYTYKLVYSSTVGGSSAGFSSRRLWARVLPST